jgi:hypothetical protein
LFSDILQGVGRNRLDGAKKKGGFKVQGMMDNSGGALVFVWITKAREHVSNLVGQQKN